MYRLLLPQVLRNACCSVSERHIGGSSQLWESNLRFLWLSPISLAQSCSSVTKSPPQPQVEDSDNPLRKQVSETLLCVVSSDDLVMESRIEILGEVKTKRTREFLSPLRPTGSEKKVKGNGSPSPASSTPPLICLDDIPLPTDVLTTSKKKKKKKMPSLEFIPLPASPPPLPPPLPSPPPPPDHSEMDEVLADFMIFDTEGTSTLFPVPLPPHFKASHNKSMEKGNRNDINSVPCVVDIADDDDNHSAVHGYDGVLPDQFKNIRIVDKSMKKKSCGKDHIDIVFEGKWPWIVKSPEESRNKKHHLFSVEGLSSQSVRNCHQSTKYGYKTIKNSPEPEIITPLDTSEPEIITLETSETSVLGRDSPEDFISLDTNQSILCEGENSELLNMESQKKKDKRSKKLKRKNKKHLNEMGAVADDAEGSVFTVLSRETSPDVQKVSVVDPDFVKIDDDFPVNSECVDMEVVDVYDSDHEHISVGSPSHFADIGNPEEADVIDVPESDQESIASDSGAVRGAVDISTDDFVALGTARLENLENTEIDIEDNVLELREKLEDSRQWVTTRLGESVLMNGRVKKKDIIFSVMSYNVLAQQLLMDNPFLYTQCEKEHLDWSYRWALLQHEIEDLDPDVLLLQEVQASHYFSHFLPWLTLKGYEGLYKKRSGTKCDGCAIFFKTNKFSIMEHCTVEYFQPKAKKVLDRDNIAIIAKLVPINKPESAVCFATTHLLYNPRRHDVKLAQAVLLLTELDRICYEGEENGVTQYCPIILSGDFNCEPHAAMVDLFKEGRIHYEGLSSRTLTPNGTFPVLGAELIPPSLGITDRCQHSVLAQSRFVEKRTGKLFSLADKRKIEESLLRLHNSDRTHRLKGVGGSTSGPPPTGWFSHNFNFNSVYHHYSKRSAEATTFHNKWTTVDYILYSRVYSQDRGEAIEGKLKLLGRYGLLTGSEASKFAPLPSSVCPSDHFPLAAQFLLRNK